MDVSNLQSPKSEDYHPERAFHREVSENKGCNSYFRHAENHLQNSWVIDVSNFMFPDSAQIDNFLP